MDRLTQQLATALADVMRWWATTEAPTGDDDMMPETLFDDAQEALAAYNRALGPVPPGTLPDSGSNLYLVHNPDGSNLLCPRETVDLLMAFAEPQFPMVGKSLMLLGGNRANRGKLWMVEPVDSVSGLLKPRCDEAPSDTPYTDWMIGQAFSSANGYQRPFPMEWPRGNEG